MNATATKEGGGGPPGDKQRLLVVAHPDDEVLEFLSILEPPRGPGPCVLVCSEGQTGRTSFLEKLAREGRLAKVAFYQQPSDFDRALDPERLRDFLSSNAPSSAAEVWTHSPADLHPQHCQVALAVSETFPHLPVFYSHGIFASEFQFATDVCHALSPEQIGRKIEILNQEYADQARYYRRWLSSGFATESILSVERFLRLTADEVKRLYALRHSLDAEVALIEDPWNFNQSDYEKERFDHSLDWVRRWAHPQIHSLVEVGSCEGAFTKRLVRAGYHRLTACEPNDLFRARLAARLRDSPVTISELDLGGLSDGRPVSADFYLLLEMLYYLSDFSLLNRLPTDRLLVAMNDEFYYETFERWMQTDRTWRVVDETVLAFPRVDYTVGTKAYTRKRGSRGAVLYRQQFLS